MNLIVSVAIILLNLYIAASIDRCLMVATEEVIFPSQSNQPDNISARLLSQSKRPSSRHLIMLSHRVQAYVMVFQT